MGLGQGGEHSRGWGVKAVGKSQQPVPSPAVVFGGQLAGDPGWRHDQQYSRGCSHDTTRCRQHSAVQSAGGQSWQGEQGTRGMGDVGTRDTHTEPPGDRDHIHNTLIGESQAL